MPTDFESRVYARLKQVPAGKVSTYAALAAASGRPLAVRAVGNALNRNPYAPEVPCHRIVKSDGRLGGYAKGPEQKERRLKNEGVEVENGRIADFNRILYKFL